MNAASVAIRLFLLLAVAGGGGAQPLSVGARDAYNMGIREFQARQFKAAAESFQKAVERAPGLMNARVYMAASLVHAYVANDASEENAAVAKAALAACQDALKRDVKNVLSTDSLATLYFQMKEFSLSREWNLKVLALAPESKTSLYMLGAIAWSEFSGVLHEARVKLGMAPDDKGPLPDELLRRELAAQWLKPISEGIEYERAALMLDPEYARAMLSLVDLYRARADICSPAEYEADMKLAVEWMEKAATVALGDK